MVLHVAQAFCVREACVVLHGSWLVFLVSVRRRRRDGEFATFLSIRRMPNTVSYGHIGLTAPSLWTSTGSEHCTDISAFGTTHLNWWKWCFLTKCRVKSSLVSSHAFSYHLVISSKQRLYVVVSVW